ncbi:MAG TPA: glycosyltransferase family 39 protein [Aliidongia sp.]|uniref:glycosyltransferase family 39 protein n=1 Tax=Aliidongia sp. TaxID=1914230 RepID=UPI002DDCC3B8|nr:glycosyltransferase family 39 protein [Aliidongia sp.]HEV2674011.1 glycosyltransferase family 39 protein [Aliidongia sp.]
MTAIDFSRVAARRRRFAPSWDLATLVLILGAIGLVIGTFHDYGITWDEDVHNWYGVFVMDYYLSWFKDNRSLHWLNLYNYGAAFDMTAAFINKVSPFGTYETRHLLNGLVGVLGVVGAWKLGRFMAGPRAGFFSAVLLLTIPNYYGQMFNNPKDIPFAVAGIWSVYYMARIVPALPRPGWSIVVKLGVVIGLSLGVRVGGLLFFGYAGLTGLLYCAWRAVETRDAALVLRELVQASGRVLVPMLAISYAVMLVFWPWAQQAPIEHPLTALDYFSHVTFPFTTLFAGKYFPATDLPWEYLPTHVVLAMPELTLALTLAAIPAAFVEQARRRGGPDRTRSLQYGVIAIAALFPIAYAVAIKAVLFDGMRHFIFVLPPFAVAAALVADHVIDRLKTFRWRPLLVGLVSLYGIAHLAIMIELHPDQYVYYNGLVGGVDGAQTLFKTDYWGNSYAEAVKGLTNYLETEYGAEFEDHDFTVAVCGPPISADYFFPDNFVFTDDREKADFFIAFTKDNCNNALPGKEVFRVERMGALLSIVLDRREMVQAAEHAPEAAQDGNGASE